MKKVVKIIIIALAVMIAISLIFFLIDYSRVQKKEKPIFCIESPSGEANDGGTIEYLGLGYKVIDFNMLTGYDEMKIGTWFMKYEDFADEYTIYEQSNMMVKMEAIIMEVHESGLSIAEIINDEITSNLYSVSFAEEGNIGFKPGQEIEIYYDGIVASSFPEQIHNVGKIIITKEESDKTIPDGVLRYYNNDKDKVNVNVSELTNKGITVNITDTNELPYEYTNDYVLYKEVKNEGYTEEGYKIGEDTGNSTSGYTGTGSEYIWEEVNKNDEVVIEDTIEDLIYNLPNMTENYNYTVIGKKIDWTSLYGELSDGNYRLIFSNSGTVPISIEFSVENSEAKLINIEKY